MPNLLSTAEARVLVGTSLNDDDLESVITREEAWLARRIGPLSGERTESLRTSWGDETRLWLRRPTDTVTVTDAGTELDPSAVMLAADGLSVDLVQGYWAATGSYPALTVDIAYTPNDEDEVKRVVIELLRLTTLETGIASLTVEGYSFTRDKGAASSRLGLVRELLPRLGAGTIRLRSSSSPSGALA